RLAERVVDLLAPTRSPIGLEEQRAGAVAIAHQDLVGQPHLHRHAEHVRVEALGPSQIGNVDAEVIEMTESHRFPLRGLRSLMTERAAVRTVGSASALSVVRTRSTSPPSPRTRPRAAMATTRARAVPFRAASIKNQVASAPPTCPSAR